MQNRKIEMDQELVEWNCETFNNLQARAYKRYERYYLPLGLEIV